MIKAIIFDCFGVLVGKGFWATYEAAGGDPIKDEAFIHSMLDKANSGAISDRLFSVAMAEKLGMDVHEWEQVMFQEEVCDTQLFDYIKNELKPHYKIALLSNTNVGVVEQRIPAEYLGLFEVKVLSAEVGYMKPEPTIYKIAIDRLGIKPEEAVFVDDHERYVAAANDFGINSFVYKGLQHFKQDLNHITSN